MEKKRLLLQFKIEVVSKKKRKKKQRRDDEIEFPAILILVADVNTHITNCLIGTAKNPCLLAGDVVLNREPEFGKRYCTFHQTASRECCSLGVIRLRNHWPLSDLDQFYDTRITIQRSDQTLIFLACVRAPWPDLNLSPPPRSQNLEINSNPCV